MTDDVRRLKRARRDGPNAFLGPLETAVMDRLWKRRQATVRDVVDDLAKSRSLAYTTVMTIMTRLHAKGLLVR
ncbi:MAG TPA: BlaI/MecI/CopY family transcriptional regulator, partial [Candidatus Limnocylindria bacterium]